MDPELYKEYVLSLDADNGDSFNRKLLDETNQNEMLFNVKNYNT